MLSLPRKPRPPCALLPVYLVAVNYYARNDPLVKLDRRAAELMKLTNNTKFQEVIFGLFLCSFVPSKLFEVCCLSSCTDVNTTSALAYCGVSLSLCMARIGVLVPACALSAALLSAASGCLAFYSN